MRLKEANLQMALQKFLRWETEGKLKYLYAFRGGGEPFQMYYDDYHDHISREGDRIFGFRIQIDDSPEGDIWESGKFQVLDYGEIKILEHHAYMN